LADELGFGTLLQKWLLQQACLANAGSTSPSESGPAS
jgi:hypothetical protein